MRTIWELCMVGAVGAVLGTSGPEKGAGAPKPEPFAVVELFTSEGCSSCPPADKVLAEMAGAARTDKTRVFCLSFHVDYWDNLGWADPYGDKAYSERQKAYVKALNVRSAYTPQMVVNGKEEFVGSHGEQARKAVAAAMKKPARAGVAATTKRGSADKPVVSVEYQVSGAPAGSTVNVALVERGLSSDVKRGENAGEKLRHENVVRAFVTAPPGKDGKGSAELRVPEGVKLANALVIVYVQDPGSLVVHGVAGAEIAETPAAPGAPAAR